MEENKTPQDIEQYQEHYSESGLFSKIGKVCKKAGMKAIYYVLLLYYVLVANLPLPFRLYTSDFQCQIISNASGL